MMVGCFVIHRYQVLTVTPMSNIEAENLERLVKATGSEAFNDIVPGRRADILVPPNQLSLIKEQLQKYNVAIPDVGR